MLSIKEWQKNLYMETKEKESIVPVLTVSVLILGGQQAERRDRVPGLGHVTQLQPVPRRATVELAVVEDGERQVGRERRGGRQGSSSG